MSTKRPLVAVGFDGSPSAMSAVEWADDYARATGADIEVVTAWHYPSSYGVAVPLSGWDPQLEAAKILDKAVAALHLPPERIKTMSEHAYAADLLVRASEHADLVVVGNRGHNGFTGLLLGSVSSHVTHHARCPVVVVR